MFEAFWTVSFRFLFGGVGKLKRELIFAKIFLLVEWPISITLYKSTFYWDIIKRQLRWNLQGKVDK